MSKAIIILGMHRSGTSMLTRICNLLGLELGSPLIPAQSDNEGGFWEHWDVVRLHDELLSAIDRCWSSITPFPEGWVENQAVAPIRQKLAQLIDKQFADVPMWAVKDPRMCRTIPFWQPLLTERSIEPHVILTCRHPFEVSRSLHVRNGFSLNESLILWLLHTLEAERDTRGMKRAFVYYPDLLNDWKATMRIVSEQMDIKWPKKSEEISSEVAQFLKPEMRHHAVEVVKGEGKIQELALEVHNLMVKATKTKEIDQGRLDAINYILLEILKPFSDILNNKDILLKQASDNAHQMAENARQIAENAHHSIEELNKQIIINNDASNNVINNIYASTSWKITRPIRGIIHFAQNFSGVLRSKTTNNTRESKN